MWCMYLVAAMLCLVLSVPAASASLWVSLQTALIKEQSDSSRGFQLQLQKLYEQFQAVDKGIINLTLYENGYGELCRDSVCVCVCVCVCACVCVFVTIFPCMFLKEHYTCVCVMWMWCVDVYSYTCLQYTVAQLIILFRYNFDSTAGSLESRFARRTTPTVKRSQLVYM